MEGDQLDPKIAERRAQLAKEIDADGTDDNSSSDLIDDQLIAKVVPIVRVLAPHSHLPTRLTLLQDRRCLVTAWNGMVRLLKDGDYPDGCLPERIDENSVRSMPDAFRREGQPELAGWAEQVLAEKGGAGTLFQILLHLQRQAKKEAERAAPGPR